MLTFRQSPRTWLYPNQTNSSNQTTTRRPSILCCSDSLEQKTTKNEVTSSAGRIRRFVLTQEGRTKLNNLPDREFYAYPRFVKHVDDSFILSLTDLYRKTLRPEMEILDLMSSWISHLPEEIRYKKVVGHGLNAQELARNPRLDYFFVKDLNKDQQLELESASLDAVLCTVSVQYLQQPEKVSPSPNILL